MRRMFYFSLGNFMQEHFLPWESWFSEQRTRWPVRSMWVMGESREAWPEIEIRDLNPEVCGSVDICTEFSYSQSGRSKTGGFLGICSCLLLTGTGRDSREVWTSLWLGFASFLCCRFSFWVDGWRRISSAQVHHFKSCSWMLMQIFPQNVEQHTLLSWHFW